MTSRLINAQPWRTSFCSGYHQYVNIWETIRTLIDVEGITELNLRGVVDGVGSPNIGSDEHEKDKKSGKMTESVKVMKVEPRMIDDCWTVMQMVTMRAGVSEKTASDKDDEEEENKEVFVRTPGSFDFNDDDDDEEYEELYKDVNVRLTDTKHEEQGKEDEEMRIIFGKVYSLKRDREDKDKDEDPLAGSDQGLKKQKTSKDVEPSRGSKSQESKSSSSKGTKSQPKSSRKSTQAEEPVFEAADTEMPLNQGDDVGNINDQPNIEATPKDDWFKKPKRPPTPDSDWNTTNMIDFRPPQT
ncbi:hypothetical protein Tco_0665834 [Tanacetum coccineum]